MEKGMTTKEINVIKRDGTKTPLDLDKVHRMVELACEGLAGVSESHVEVNSGRVVCFADLGYLSFLP